MEKSEKEDKSEYLKKYVEDVLGFAQGEIGDLQKSAYKEGLPIIPKDVEKLLEFILSVHKPEKILEIGCCVGFSSSLMTTITGAEVTTIDRYDIMINAAKENFKRLGTENKITLLEGDAGEILKTLSGSYDFIFMDAAKGQYINFLPDCLRLLKVGGILFTDDIFQEGRIARERLQVPRRQRTIHTRLRMFIDEITKNECLKTTLLTIGDGVALCHKIKEN